MVKRIFAMLAITLLGTGLITGCNNSSMNVKNEEIKDSSATADKEESLDSQAVTEELPWWKKVNAYEIYVKSFKDSDGDGQGDIKGITEELDYLASLGVGAIWLTPVYKSPQADNGYDIADYYQLDETYGTMEDTDTLIAEAGKRDIRIVMDLVFNHTSNENAWFVESASGKDNDKSDWYIWRDPRPDGSAPTNWRSIFGDSAWTWNEERGQYYLHTFLPEQPDLNWENPEVRQALFDVANFWIDKGVGGFRMDAVTYIKKPADFKDGKPDADDGLVGVHSMTANTEGILDYLKEFKENVCQGKDIFTVGEANGVEASELSDWVGDDGVFDMVFEFSHVNIDLIDESNWCETRDWKLTDLKKCLSDTQENTGDQGWCPVFFENHDISRSIDHYLPGCSDEKMGGKALGTVLFTLRGTPFIYQGEELGMRNVNWPSIDDYNDISTKNHYDFCIEQGYPEEECMDAVHLFFFFFARTPMQWSGGANAGFTTGKPWLALADNYKTCNVEIESEAQDSVLTWYRTLADLKKNHQVLIDGSYEEIFPEDEQIYAFSRDNGKDKAVILVNLSDKEASYDPAVLDGCKLLLSSLGNKSETGSLKPYESAIYLQESE